MVSFALKIIRKKLLLNIILIVQILFTSVLLLGFVGRIQYNINTESLLNYANINNAYYLYLYDQYVDELSDGASSQLQNSENNRSESRRKIVLEKLEGIKEINAVGQVKNILCEYQSGEVNGQSFCYVYNQALIENMKCPLLKGDWFSGYKKESNLIPIIVSQDIGLDINETVDLNLTNPDMNESSKYKGIVIGILDPLNYIYSFTEGGSKMGLNCLISRSDDVIIVPQSYVEKENSITLMNTPGMILFSNQNSKNIEKKISELFVGNVTSIENMSQTSNKEFISFLLSNGLILVVFVLLTVAGIGGNNGLQQITNEKNFAIYYLLGNTWRECIHIEIWRTILIIGIPYILLILFYFMGFLKIFYNESNTIINVLTFIVVLVYIIIVYSITTLSTILSMKHCSPAQIIKRWE